MANWKNTRKDPDPHKERNLGKLHVHKAQLAKGCLLGFDAQGGHARDRYDNNVVQRQSVQDDMLRSPTRVIQKTSK